MQIIFRVQIHAFGNHSQIVQLQGYAFIFQAFIRAPATSISSAENLPIVPAHIIDISLPAQQHIFIDGRNIDKGCQYHFFGIQRPGNSFSTIGGSNKHSFVLYPFPTVFTGRIGQMKAFYLHSISFSTQDKRYPFVVLEIFTASSMSAVGIISLQPLYRAVIIRVGGPKYVYNYHNFIFVSLSST